MIRRYACLTGTWRGIDAATNVLSFPAKRGSAGRHLGDIVLAYETIAREARGEHKPLAHHVAHLAVHGFLHLLGYDHERDEDARGNGTAPSATFCGGSRSRIRTGRTASDRADETGQAARQTSGHAPPQNLKTV